MKLAPAAQSHLPSCALLHVCAGKATLLGRGASCDPPLCLHPVADAQRMANVSVALEKLHGMGLIPQPGQVRGGLERTGQTKGWVGCMGRDSH